MVSGRQLLFLCMCLMANWGFAGQNDRLRVAEVYEEDGGTGVLIRVEMFAGRPGVPGEWIDELSSLSASGWYFSDGLEHMGGLTHHFYKLATNHFQTFDQAPLTDEELKGEGIKRFFRRPVEKNKIDFVIYATNEQKKIDEIRVTGELEATVEGNLWWQKVVRQGSLHFTINDKPYNYTYQADKMDYYTNLIRSKSSILFSAPDVRKIEYVFTMPNEKDLLIVDVNTIPGMGRKVLETYRVIYVNLQHPGSPDFHTLKVEDAYKLQSTPSLSIGLEGGRRIRYSTDPRHGPSPRLEFKDGTHVMLTVDTDVSLEALEERGIDIFIYVYAMPLTYPCRGVKFARRQQIQELSNSFYH